MLALLSCIAIAATADVDAEPSPAWRWQAAAQAGSGAAAGEWVAVVRSQVSLLGPWLQAALAPSLWVGTDSTLQTKWRNDWHDPETYAAFVQTLSLSALDEKLHLRLAPLTVATLGEGVLVDGYRSSLDFMRPRTGGYGTWEDGRVRVELWSASLVAADMLAAQVAVAPLAWSNEPSQRWRVFAEAAVDVQSERGGGNLGTSLRIVETEHVALAPFLSAATWSDGGAGGHLGLAGELAQDASTFLRLRIDAALGTADYQPGRFGPAYTVVRTAPRIAADSLWHLRGRLSGGLGAWTLGINATGRPGASTSLEVTLVSSVERWRMAASWVAQDRARPADFARFDDSTYAQIEGAFRVQGAVFLFTAFQRGRTSSGPAAVRWVVGIGGAVGNSLD